MTAQAAGLEGIVAGRSSICTVGREGSDLQYRGYSLTELVDRDVSWEELAYVLINDQRPSRSELETWNASIVRARKLPDSVTKVVQSIPSTTDPMDELRTAWSFLGNVFPEGANSTDDVIAQLLGSGPTLTAAWWNAAHNVPIATDYPHTDQGGYFLYLLRGGKMPTDDERRMMNTSFLLYMEHGFNASTFAARVTTSTLADMWSAVVAAVGTLKGPLHGGANERAMELIATYKTADEAEKGIIASLARKDKIMGFGHRVYRIRDPRSDVMKAWVRKLAPEGSEHAKQFAVAERIEQVMMREKKLFPNADFYSALAYNILQIPIPLYTPIFAFSRVAGWIAHIMEQRADNRLIRPMEEYVGPEKREW